MTGIGRELLRPIAKSQKTLIYAGYVDIDHMHLLVSIRQQLSISLATPFTRGKFTLAKKHYLCL